MLDFKVPAVSNITIIMNNLKIYDDFEQQKKRSILSFFLFVELSVSYPVQTRCVTGGHERFTRGHKSGQQVEINKYTIFE